jgi:hypothetical protein
MINIGYWNYLFLIKIIIIISHNVLIYIWIINFLVDYCLMNDFNLNFNYIIASYLLIIYVFIISLFQILLYQQLHFLIENLDQDYF